MPISWAMSFPEAGYAFAIPVSTAHWASLTGLTDSRDYAGFMRSAFRSSLAANYTARSLGFRCARDSKAAVGQ